MSLLMAAGAAVREGWDGSALGPKLQGGHLQLFILGSCQVASLEASQVPLLRVLPLQISRPPV